MTSFFGGLPTGFYEGFFNDPFLTSDMDFDMLPLEAQNQFLLQQQPQQQGDRSQQQMASRGQRRRAAREQALQRGMRVNLVQEEEKYCVCFEVPGRTKDDLCVALEVASPARTATAATITHSLLAHRCRYLRCGV